MIQAVIFDCFGVLTTDAWLPFKEQYFGHDKKLMDEATDLNKRSDAGFMSYLEFIHGIGLLAGIEDRAVKQSIENNVPNEPLFSWIQALKKDYKIGLLSNAAVDWTKELFTTQHMALFDAVSLSCNTGFVKPDSRAYEAVAEQLGVPVEDCLLIDDQDRNCTGANDAGMQAIWYKNVEQCHAEFDQLRQS